MMQPIVLKYDSLARGIEQAGNAIGNALEKRADKRYEQENLKQQSTILSDLLQKMPKDASPDQFINMAFEAQKLGVTPALTKQVLDYYAPMMKTRMETQIADEFLNRGSNSQNPNSSFQNNQPLETPTNPKASPIANINSAKVNPINPNIQLRNPKEYSDEEIRNFSLSPSKMHQRFATNELKLRSMNQKKFEADRAYHSVQSNKAIDRVSQIRDTLPLKENSLRLMRSAIETGETGPLSMANIAQRMGVPEFMNAAGTELNQAGKEFFFGNMTRVSAKAQNQWLEQRIAGLSANVGDPKTNALMKQAIIESEFELGKTYVNEFDKLKAEDMKNYGYVRNDIEERAYKNSEEKAKNILNKASYQTRELFERDKPNAWFIEQANSKKKVPKGTSLTGRMAKAFATNRTNGNFEKAWKTAEKMGYSVPTKEQAIEWSQEWKQ